ncbi:hypothetical protein BD324DRAFT_622673 [Kockovaella imperatae]|uniref:Zn(2)-C6 fungal-type domain-containing protein n=1 Tax=Kockovaella imperatae TaxID=4999 RepID=A0A1Y1UHV9_9TREE|nr:hypothetical protein BD324DRAFT_622673 [Kockovaella imperatae]ORX37628.1 hypothetical protein BD324DRAFT_622673 [Kockovaella imperatae]
MPKEDPGSLDSIDWTMDTADAAGISKAPLKRGDACLYCRKRRIKCSAEKPTCAHCRKGKRECVYDTGKPVSRVKQLEEKVAELEGMLKSSIPSNGRSSDTPPEDTSPPSRHDSSSSYNGFSAFTDPGFVNISQSQPYTVPANPPIDPLTTFAAQQQSYSVNVNQLPHNSSTSSFLPTPAPPNQQDFGTFNLLGSTAGPSGVSQQAVDEFDFSMLDPSIVSLLNTMVTSVNPFSQQSTGHTDPLPQPAVPPPQPTRVTSDSSQSSGLTPYLNLESTPATSISMAEGRDSVPSSYTPESVPIQLGAEKTEAVSYSAYVTDLPSGSPRNIAEGFFAGKMNGNTAQDEPMPDQELMGGWFDAADLPKVARDHLLDLFFTKMVFFGQMFHIPRFFASLTLPPAKRPHQSLLYAMYLIACKNSTSPSIRVLETHFASIVLRQIDEALSKAEKMFDVVRACALMAVYHFASAHYHEGWMMTGRAARLAISCGLHAIPSSEFSVTKIDAQWDNDLTSLMRKRSWVIPPPSDPVELGERIWAFWMIYVTDRCGAISTMWECAIPDHIVTTPYPHPLYEFELGLVTKADDRSTSSIWSEKLSFAPLPPYADSTLTNVRMRSLGILDRASKLVLLDPEEGWETRLPNRSSVGSPVDPPTNSPPEWSADWLSPEQYQTIFGTCPAAPGDQDGLPKSAQGPEGAQGHPTQGSGKGWMRTAKYRTPKAYEAVKRALERLEADLMPEFKTEWWTWDGVPPRWHASAASGPRKALWSLHFVIGCSWMFLFDVNSFNEPNDLAIGCARRMVCSIAKAAEYISGSEMDVFTIMTWSFIVKTLIREVKRLHGLNLPRRAAPLETEIEIIVSSMKTFGSRMNIASAQAERSERYRSSTREETKFLEDDDALDRVETHLKGPKGLHSLST